MLSRKASVDLKISLVEVIEYADHFLVSAGYDFTGQTSEASFLIDAHTCPNYSPAGQNPVIPVGLRDEMRKFLTPKKVVLDLDNGGLFNSVFGREGVFICEAEIFWFTIRMASTK